MDKYEVNKIISDYMDNKNPIPINIDELSDKQRKMYLPYVCSLDALIPIWEKAVLEIHNTNWHNQKEWHVVLFKRGYRFDWSKAKTIQEAAAHATAEAILKLNE